LPIREYLTLIIAVALTLILIYVLMTG